MNSLPVSAYVRTVARNLGMLLHLPGTMGILVVVVIAATGDWLLMPGFLMMMIVSFGSGQLLFRTYQSAKESIPSISYITVALAWLIIPLLGAIPLWSAALLMPTNGQVLEAYHAPLNAFFEAMSGFTSTGLTTAQDASALPRTLQWWRTLMEWIGGVGVIVLALALVEPEEDNYGLYAAEARSKQIGSDLRSTARWIWWLYLGYTILAILAFWLVGMPWWEALNHGMTGIGTGGFVVTSNSFQEYSTAIKIIGVLVMCLGAISFQTHYLMLIQHQWHTVLLRTQVRAFFVIFGLGLLLLGLANLAHIDDFPAIDTLFQWASALGTAGFNSVNVAEWSQTALLLMVIGMLMGGASGSTTGGLKLNRVAWLAKGLIWRLRSIWVYEDEKQRYFYNGKEIQPDEATRHVSSAAVFAGLWAVTVFAATVGLSLIIGEQYLLHEVLFEATSALGSVGLSVGITGPDLHWSGRLILILLMWLGRLEIIPVLILIGVPFAWRFRQSNLIDEDN